MKTFSDKAPKGSDDHKDVTTDEAPKSTVEEPQTKSDTEAPLPEGAQEPPRNEEEMHLKHIRKWPNAVKTYLMVSDDEGQLLGSKVLERKIKQFCDQYEDLDPKEIKDPEKVRDEALELVTKYTLQINMVESGITGIINKYRIRQGMVFIILKNLVKATNGPKWMDWFKANFDKREFRSVQDYMRLAKIPGIIRYAVFGKERLLQILRQLNDEDKKAEDPVGAFIERNGIDFNPEEEVDAQELRIETDIAINLEKLQKAGLEEIPREMVDALVRNGKEVEPSHIVELQVTKKAGEDLLEKFKQIVSADGRIPPNMTPERKAEGFKRTTDLFLKAIDSAIEDQEYRGRVNADIITQLREKLRQLESLIPST